MRIKQGDDVPSLVITLTNNTDPVDLTSATAVRVVGMQGTTQVIDDDAPSLGDPTDGVVTHTWVEGETDTVGRIWVNVVVTFADGATQTFPPYGSLAVDIGAGEVVPVPVIG